MSTLPYHPPSATNVSAVEGEKRQMVRGKRGLLASPCQGGEGGDHISFHSLCKEGGEGQSRSCRTTPPPPLQSYLCNG